MEDNLLKFAVVLDPSEKRSEWMRDASFDIDFMERSVTGGDKSDKVKLSVDTLDLYPVLSDWNLTNWTDNTEGILPFRDIKIKEGLEIASFENHDTGECLQVFAANSPSGRPVVSLVFAINESTIPVMEEFLDTSVICDEVYGLGFKTPDLKRAWELEANRDTYQKDKEKLKLNYPDVGVIWVLERNVSVDGRKKRTEMQFDNVTDAVKIMKDRLKEDMEEYSCTGKQKVVNDFLKSLDSQPFVPKYSFSVVVPNGDRFSTVTIDSVLGKKRVRMKSKNTVRMLYMDDVKKEEKKKGQFM